MNDDNNIKFVLLLFRCSDSNNTGSLIDDSLLQTSDGEKLLNFLKNKRVETKPLFMRTIQKNVILI